MHCPCYVLSVIYRLLLFYAAAVSTTKSVFCVISGSTQAVPDLPRALARNADNIKRRKRLNTPI